MNSIIDLIISNLKDSFNSEIIIFIISMCPILELRGGLLASAVLNVSIKKAIPICIIGNIIPIPLILLFIGRIFNRMKKYEKTSRIVCKLENKVLNKSEQIQKYGFWGLVIFVGIPFPGTGSWTGSLIAELLGIDIKKALLAELIGIIMATIIMSILSYGLLDVIMRG